MATALITGAYLTSIANAIRSKNGSSDTYLPSEMAAAIQALDTDTDIVSKTITANGTYTASDEGHDGYSPVVVNVPSDTLVAKTITANGTYDPADDSADGYSSVTVNVSSSLPSAEGVSF